MSHAAPSHNQVGVKEVKESLINSAKSELFQVRGNSSQSQLNSVATQLELNEESNKVGGKSSQIWSSQVRSGEDWFTIGSGEGQIGYWSDG